MKPKRWYALHRWLGALLGLQLLLWSLGGFIFAVHDIDDVRGMADKDPESQRAVPADVPLISPTNVLATIGEPVRELRLGMLLDRPVYEAVGATPALYDARTGAPIPSVDEATAIEVASRDRTSRPPVSTATLITADPPTEYRDKPLPAYQVAFEDGAGTRIYISAATGRITARRNTEWRRFDFFWMLHTMDYSGRDDFNSPWLIGLSALGVITVLSGFCVWAVRLIRRRRKRRRSA